MDFPATSFRYWAFISYSHADEAWAKWLHRQLETYRVPRRLVGSEGPVGARPRRLMPVFRDRDELSSSSELGRVIDAALQESRFLIVICSPNAARSLWVDAEIRRFKALGRERQVLAMVVEGQPNASDAALECFPLALRRRLDASGEVTDIPCEPIAADARPFADHKHGAKLKLIAGLLGVGYDDLVQRERQRRFWSRVQIAAAAIALGVALAAIWGWFERREAERLAELRVDRLLQLGRAELDQDRHARAAVYFSAALAQGRDDLALRYWLARAMRPVDAVEPRALDLLHVVLEAGLNTDGTRLLSTDADSAEWWDLRKGERLWQRSLPLAAVVGTVEIVERSGRALVSGIPDKSGDYSKALTVILDLHSGAIVATVPGELWSGAGRRVSPDGRRFLVGVMPPVPDVSQYRVAVYDLLDGHRLAELDGPQGVVSPSFSDDGNRILTGGEGSGEVRIWDAQTYALIRHFQPRQRVPHAAYWSGRGEEVLTVSEAGAVKLWDGATGQLIDAMGSQGPFGFASSVVGRRYLLTGSVKDATVWDLERGQSLFISEQVGGLDDHESLDASGQRLLGIAADIGAGLWNVAEGALEYRLDVHAASTARVLFEPGDRHIVSISGDGKLRWLRTADLARPLARLQHEAYVSPVEGPGVGVLALQPEGSTWISGGADGTLRTWRADTGEALAALHTHEAAIRRIVRSVPAKLWVAGDRGGQLAAWDGQSTQPAWRMHPAGDAELLSLDAHPAGETIAALDADGTLSLLDARNGAVRDRLSLGKGATQAMLVGKGELLLVLHESGPAELWDLQARARRSVLGSASSGVMSAVASPDRLRVVLADTHGDLSLWDVREGRPIAALARKDIGGGGLHFRVLRFSSDGRVIAAGGHDGIVALWEPAQGRVQVLRGHQYPVSAIDFDPHGRLLATGTLRGELHVWDLASGQLLDRLRRSNQDIEAIAFNGDGSRVANTEYLDDVVRVHDVHVETREAPAIRKLIACVVPWQLEGMVLEPRNPDACPASTAVP
jgi:WD40 repeat protein